MEEPRRCLIIDGLRQADMEEPRRCLIIDGLRQADMEEPRRCLIINGPRQEDYEILLSALKKILDELDNLPPTNY